MEYKIGTDHSDLDWIYNQLTANGLNRAPDPRGEPMEYASPSKIGDGTTKNFGWLQQEWHWDVLTEAQCADLRAFIGSVNILTRNNAGTFVEYTGIMEWPEREPEHFDNHVLDVTVNFIQLVVV
jgi:hypothetical protein